MTDNMIFEGADGQPIVAPFGIDVFMELVDLGLIEESEEYTLNIGCIQGNRITSRDSETRKFDTLEEAKESLANSERFWKTIGYRVWFAVITDKDGNEVYRR